AFRVAFMECAAAGGDPFSVVIQNFNGDTVWNSLLSGVQQGIYELGISELPVTGSTETNFTLQQSALGITVLGKRLGEAVSHQTNMLRRCEADLQIAIIGSPLLGDEVLKQKEEVVPLDLFQWFCEQEEVLAVLPVGSKGISYELKQLFSDRTF